MSVCTEGCAWATWRPINCIIFSVTYVTRMVACDLWRRTPIPCCRRSWKSAGSRLQNGSNGSEKRVSFPVHVRRRSGLRRAPSSAERHRPWSLAHDLQPNALAAGQRCRGGPTNRIRSRACSDARSTATVVLPTGRPVAASSTLAPRNGLSEKDTTARETCLCAVLYNTHAAAAICVAARLCGGVTVRVAVVT